MAPQDDLTAERAAKLVAFELVKKLTDNAGMDPNDRWDKVNLLLAYRQTARQEALREAKEVAKSELRNTMLLTSCPGQSSAAWNIMWKLDRLASEGA